MPIDVQMPDGTIIRNVPEGTTKSQLTEKLRKAERIRDASTQPANTGIGRTIFDQSMQGATFGGSDEGMASIGALYARTMRPELFEDESYSDTRNQALASKRRDIKAQQEERPVLSTASQIGGAVLTGGALSSPKAIVGAIPTSGVRGAVNAIPQAGAQVANYLGKGSLPARMVKSGGLGGLAAGAQGFGEGEGGVENRLESARKSGQIGAGVGMLLPAGGALFSRKTPLPSSDGFEEAVGTVRGAARALDDKIDDAFTVAKSKRALVSKPNVINPLKNKISRSLNESGIFIDDAGNQTAKRFLGELDKFSSKSAVSLNRMEMWRRRVTNAANKTNDPTLASALRTMRDSYDDIIQNNVRGAIVRGDDEAVGAWRKAIGLRRDKGRIFGTNRKTGQSRIFEDIVSKEELTNEKIANAIQFNRQDAGQVVKRMLSAAGDQKEAVRQNLRKGYIARMFDKSLAKGRDEIDANALQREINKLLRGNKTVLNQVFDAKDIKALEQFRSGLNRGILDKAFLTPLQNFLEFPLVRVGTFGSSGLASGAINVNRQIGQTLTVNKFLTEVFNEAAPQLRGKPVFYGNLVVGSQAPSVTVGEAQRVPPEQEQLR